MLEQNFQSVYEKFKLQFFRRLFSQFRRGCFFTPISFFSFQWK